MLYILLTFSFFFHSKVARKRIRRRGKPANEVVLKLKNTSGSTRSLPVPSTNELVTNFSSEISTTSPNASPEKGANNNGITNITDKDSAKVEILPKKKLHLKESIESKRERKAAKTLAIITGINIAQLFTFLSIAPLFTLFIFFDHRCVRHLLASLLCSRVITTSLRVVSRKSSKNSNGYLFMAGIHK
jgi:predicted PurR-regulated permease PerM